jgi:hypothetical protein
VPQTIRYQARHLLPLLSVGSLALTGGYDARFIGVGSDEFRRVINAAMVLTAMIAVISYAVKFDTARSYLVVALPSVATFDLVARYWLRRRLHRLRRRGACMHKVVAVGHAAAVADLIGDLRRSKHHGLSVVGAYLAGGSMLHEISGVPVCGGLTNVTSVVSHLGADTVAVLTCPEMNGTRLRQLAWDLEKTGTDMCVAPALLDVAGPRTTIRPVAGLTLLHMDHPRLDGGKRVVKGAFDKVVALLAVVLLAPLFALIMVAIKLDDHGPVFFRQTRVGKDGHTFSVWKFRTMVVDAEQPKAELAVGARPGRPVAAVPVIARPAAAAIMAGSAAASVVARTPAPAVVTGTAAATAVPRTTAGRAPRPGPGSSAGTMPRAAEVKVSQPPGRSGKPARSGPGRGRQEGHHHLVPARPSGISQDRATTASPGSWPLASAVTTAHTRYAAVRLHQDPTMRGG